MSGMHVACLVAAGVCALGATGALMLPGRRAVRVSPIEATIATAVPEPAFD
jgi:hypothetical protein